MANGEYVMAVSDAAFAFRKWGVNKKCKGLMLVDQRFVLISRTSGDFAPVHELSTHGKDARPARSPGGRPSIRGPVTP